MLLALGDPRPATAQIGALVSPGRLNRAHASLEGITNCLKCHSVGERVSVDKCLGCHKPVAERITQKRGVHRNVTTDCITCHVEHAGVDGELRPFDQRRFDHAAETRFRLDGLHAPIAANCAACHKGRSFLDASITCASCHTDVHKGTLGPRCESCHATSIRFADTRTRFDHARTAFPLTGAHTAVTCASCHRNNTYKGIAFGTCSSCHEDPHRRTLGGACSSCHLTQSWKTTRVDHARTGFPLRGRHADIRCVDCHTKPAAQVRLMFDTCAICHTDPHRGEFKEDCRACHTDSGFQKGTFDHTMTRFPLTDRHAPVLCVGCHKGVTLGSRLPAAKHAVDFRGLRTTCESCHVDVHRAELGTTCDNCHTARTFDVATFRHARHRAFFEGGHVALRCVQCHPNTVAPLPPSVSARPARVGFTTTAETCVSCHRDEHLGQFVTRCETCHTVADARFAVASFDHGRTRFPLTGKHVPLMCAACHEVRTREFPAGRGTTRHFTGIGTACTACHEDPHRGELPPACERCHTTETFTIRRYTHLNAAARRTFFVGRHAAASCVDCHKPPPGSAGPGVMSAGTASSRLVSFRASTVCASCHVDVHRGALGPRCEMCHRP
jgi:hypothetical protein